MKTKKAVESLTVKTSFFVPTVPNYIQTGHKMMLPVGAFSDEDLRKIAAGWTEALLRNAERQRKQGIA